MGPSVIFLGSDILFWTVWETLGEVPESVEDFPIIPDPEQLVGSGDPVGVGPFGVPEKGVWEPDPVHHVCVESQSVEGTVKAKTSVIPRLGKEDVDGVFL